MSKIKFTGTNIAAAILVLFYFFPWVSITPLSMSGASITSNGISPGLFAYFIHGPQRFFMILAILVPASGALILYQNITGDKKFSKYFKLAHLLPAAYFIIGIVGFYFKMKPEIPSGMEGMYNDMSSQLRDMSPGVTDVLAFGFYLSLIASVYLALVIFGKIKDKEYYKYIPQQEKVNSPVINKDIPPTTDIQPQE
jgi:hypothetical protein